MFKGSAQGCPYQMNALDGSMGRDQFATEARCLWRDLCWRIQLWYRDLVVQQNGGGKHLLHFRNEVETRRALARPRLKAYSVVWIL